MSTSTYVFGVIASALVLLLIFEMLRRKRLKERHAFGWIALGFFGLIVSVFPSILSWAADLVGVEIPSNLLFFTCIVVLFVIIIQLSTEISDSEDRLRTLAEKHAFLDERIRKIEGDDHNSQPVKN